MSRNPREVELRRENEEISRKLAMSLKDIDILNKQLDHLKGEHGELLIIQVELEQRLTQSQCECERLAQVIAQQNIDFHRSKSEKSEAELSLRNALMEAEKKCLQLRVENDDLLKSKAMLDEEVTGLRGELLRLEEEKEEFLRREKETEERWRKVMHEEEEEYWRREKETEERWRKVMEEEKQEFLRREKETEERWRKVMEEEKQESLRREKETEERWRKVQKELEQKKEEMEVLKRRHGIVMLGATNRFRELEQRLFNFELTVNTLKMSDPQPTCTIDVNKQQAASMDVMLDGGVGTIDVNEQQEKEWEYEVDMLGALQNNDELCLKAVCALYRRHIALGTSSHGALIQRRGGFNDLYGLRGTYLGKFLVDGDANGGLKKTVPELEQFDPKGVNDCRKIAFHYSKQLFEMYQNSEDPFFAP